MHGWHDLQGNYQGDSVKPKKYAYSVSSSSTGTGTIQDNKCFNFKYILYIIFCWLKKIRLLVTSTLQSDIYGSQLCIEVNFFFFFKKQKLKTIMSNAIRCSVLPEWEAEVKVTRSHLILKCDRGKILFAATNKTLWKRTMWSFLPAATFVITLAVNTRGLQG